MLCCGDEEGDRPHKNADRVAMNRMEPLPALENREERAWRRYLEDSLLAIAGVALITGILYWLHLYPRIPNISLVYLLVVLALASVRGFYAAILASRSEEHTSELQSR